MAAKEHNPECSTPVKVIGLPSSLLPCLRVIGTTLRPGIMALQPSTWMSALTALMVTRRATSNSTLAIKVMLAGQTNSTTTVSVVQHKSTGLQPDDYQPTTKSVLYCRMAFYISLTKGVLFRQTHFATFAFKLFKSKSAIFSPL